MQSGYLSHNTWIKRTFNPIFRKFGFSIVSVFRGDKFDRYAIRRYPKYCEEVDNGIDPADDWEDVFKNRPNIPCITTFSMPAINAVMPSLTPLVEGIKEEVDNKIVSNLKARQYELIEGANISQDLE